MGRRRRFAMYPLNRVVDRARSVEEKRARKTETQRHRREGERIAEAFAADAI